MLGNKTVAIIGGGPSGLVSCKSALESRLIPTVFEKNSDIGGVWSLSNGKVWDSLKTNLSVNTMMFSDYPWESDWYYGSGDFPTHLEMTAYLERYVEHFKLKGHIKFGCNVTSVHQESNGLKWIVEYSTTSTIAEKNREPVTQKQTFDCIIVAGGMFQKQRSIELVDKEKFTGEITSSGDYRNQTAFLGKSVLVVGDCNSGCEIAAELAENTVIKVTQVIKKIPWVLDKYLTKPSSNENPLVFPVEVAFFSREGSDFAKKNFKSEQQSFIDMNEWLSNVCSKQQTHKSLHKPMPSDVTPFIVISQNYTDCVINEKITVVQHPIAKIQGKTVEFANGESREIDHILCANGYSYELPYLSEEILKDLDYNPNNKKIPIILHKSTFHPTLQNIGFVGWFLPAMFPIIELQARWLSLVFSENLEPPTKEQIVEGLKEERAILASPFQKQYPHVEMVDMGDEIATIIGVMPDLEKIKSEDPHLYKLIYNNAFSTSSYRLTGPHSNQQLAKSILNNINNKYYCKNK
ncbi:hypothetical protein PPL_01117 [Heterostelium album PN500]|uniref:Flavin-containing monooxygenase n=1 Tax=Heterostelium pallidum (strain ATCC 26659 / Pp 5 / PN500) TaxID=670386 RepID=D3AY58_HETP5|nr:hypothetical protein PPL_01117 [Heterostelium album PN500]EFA85885.1 hypothetical protein PPL_01117 [Heterostelium album PN500]|eukprot:XP_020437991.1 hypothetical protein PPL_01117 [Heterostelium album PN500]